MSLADQTELERIYNAQRTEIGQAALNAQKDLASKLQAKGINTTVHVVVRMVNPKTGKSQYYTKK